MTNYFLNMHSILATSSSIDWESLNKDREFPGVANQLSEQHFVTAYIISHVQIEAYCTTSWHVIAADVKTMLHKTVEPPLSEVLLSALFCYLTADTDGQISDFYCLFTYIIRIILLSDHKPTSPAHSVNRGCTVHFEDFWQLRVPQFSALAAVGTLRS